MLKIPYKTRGYLIHFCDNTEKLGKNEKTARFGTIKADFYRERREIVELLFSQILLVSVLASISIIRQMKKEHKKELEHYKKEYRKIEEELFKCELKLIKKENEE